MSATDLYKLADPLEGSLEPERVNYATGVLLQADDFRDEQTYHRGRLATALRHIVGFGTIAGLRVRSPESEDSELELSVEPGVGIDRHGRLVEINEPYCIRLARWFNAQTTPELRAAIHRAPRAPVETAVIADLFLSAKECSRGKTPSIADGPFDALDALVPARLAEEPQLEIVLRAEGAPGDIPAPENFWPAPSASRENKLRAVLGSWDTGLSSDLDEGLQPLTEHVVGETLSSILLARIALPVTLATDAPSGTRPVLDLSTRTHVDNSLRPFIFLPGKWLGRSFTSEPLVES